MGGICSVLAVSVCGRMQMHTAQPQVQFRQCEASLSGCLFFPCLQTRAKIKLEGKNTPVKAKDSKADEGSRFLHNTGIHLKVHITQPRRHHKHLHHHDNLKAHRDLGGMGGKKFTDMVFKSDLHKPTTDVKQALFSTVSNMLYWHFPS
jgi:hypothetical protein